MTPNHSLWSSAIETSVITEVKCFENYSLDYYWQHVTQQWDGGGGGVKENLLNRLMAQQLIRFIYLNMGPGGMHAAGECRSFAEWISCGQQKDTEPVFNICHSFHHLILNS